MSYHLLDIVAETHMPAGDKVQPSVVGRVLALFARQAAHDGTGCQMDDASLAHRAQLTDRQVRRVRAALEADGLLVRVANAQPMGKGRGSTPVLYRIDVERLRARWAGTDLGVWRRLERALRADPQVRPNDPIERTPRSGLTAIDRTPRSGNGRTPGSGHKEVKVYTTRGTDLRLPRRRRCDDSCSTCDGTGWVPAGSGAGVKPCPSRM